jgi:hypothetical protein
VEAGSTKDGRKPSAATNSRMDGKALSETLALKPERGKPAFRNFREGDGNVGIIRSPLRAIALPDCDRTSFYRLVVRNVEDIVKSRPVETGRPHIR